ncbi:hypothetical protein C8F04DRAFT_1356635 [Mycena alexandri]|uniref:Uncharacterized protein n=1 Tax=Mycena alexandri TaxID=1745969 RepID=A0AAD6TF97_9AGAR|nr:hypothetical protein C8F04DRAFT_1356635 [Mycena alexandri]
MFEEAADFTQGEVKAYRKFAFPDALAVPGHDPFFSVEDAPSCVISHRFQLYLTYDDSALVTSPWTPDNASATQLKAYRSYILSDQYLGHPYFSLESPETWINPEVFETYMSMTYGSFEDYHGRHHNSTPFSSRAPSRAASSVAGSRASSRVSFIPSSKASSPVQIVILKFGQAVPPSVFRRAARPIRFAPVAELAAATPTPADKAHETNPAGDHRADNGKKRAVEEGAGGATAKKPRGAPSANPT